MPSLDAQLRQGIVDALGRLCKGRLHAGALELYHALGYRSDRTADAGAVEEFLETYQAYERLSDKQLKLLQCWMQVEIIFQVTETEMHKHSIGEDSRAFGTAEYRSLLFLAVDLPRPNYSRTHFADTTRAVNRLFNMPAIILFRYRKCATLAVIHRRIHKSDATRDVLERVSLIKDIMCLNPHRAQVDILTDVARLATNHEIHDFDQLHAEFMKIFDIEKLSRRFYVDIFRWFTWATEECSFPEDHAKAGSNERHTIRMITRLMFIWFLKEQGLIPDELFTDGFAERVLKSHDHSSTDYYRAILQNLFFATLNTEANQRSFEHDDTDTIRHSTKYHYKSLLSAPDILADIFRTIPFVNGGLFDCLDNPSQGSNGVAHLDHFGDEYIERSEQELCVPSKIFLDPHRGIFPLFRAYKFTVQESTPLENEVALDPELLGSVFENLLAAYNPETREHARHATGSYYTPRVVVEYMVRSAITMALSNKLGKGRNDSFWLCCLEDLVDESRDVDVDRLVSSEQRTEVVEAVSDLTVLDPAVGSGAFLMSVLHALTLLLRRLDPCGALWRAVQQRRGRRGVMKSERVGSVGKHTGTPPLHEDDLVRHEDTNYSRKLYLIQNSLFGVDIQPIACQISKLRFFISLAIEQAYDDDSASHSFRPLPNLETRLVAADTLVRQTDQRVLITPEADELDRKLFNNRVRYFHATTPQEKLQCKTEDGQLRLELGRSLLGTGLSNHSALQLTGWDPYDPNSSAGWFEPQHMFGRKTFDVVIGNPPYIQLQKDSGRLGRKYRLQGYRTFAATGDIYQLFFERGVRMLGKGGVLAYIASNSWLKAKYGESMRRFLGSKHTPLRLVEMGKGVFENTIVDTAVLLLREGRGDPITCLAIDKDDLGDGRFPPDADRWGELRTRRGDPWIVLSTMERRIMEKMEAAGKPLSEWDISIYRGILTGYNEAFIVTQAVRDQLVDEDASSAELLKPILRGRDIRRYHAHWAGRWLIDMHNGYDDVLPVDVNAYPAIKSHLDRYYTMLESRYDRGVTPYNLRNCAYHAEFSGDKLFWTDLSPIGRFVLEDTEMYCNNAGYIMKGKVLYYLCGFLNSHVVSWYLNKTSITTGVGLIRWIRSTVERIPIPQPHDADCRVLEELTERRNRVPELCNEIVNTLEREIDRIVYESYGLTDEEVHHIQRYSMRQY